MLLGLAVLQELFGEARVLSVVPPYRPTEAEQLMSVLEWWRRHHVLVRALTGVVAVIHCWAAVTLLLAPDAQLFTQGTWPMFELAGREVWAAGFAVGGASATLLATKSTALRLWVTWMAVLTAQSMWLGAAALAVISGRGSAMAVVFLTGMVAFTAITAGATAAEYTSEKR